MHDKLTRSSADPVPVPARPKHVGPVRRPPVPVTGSEPAADERTARVQRKADVSNPNEASEREADRVADRVMREEEPTAASTTAPGRTIQRISAKEESAEEDEKKRAAAKSATAGTKASDMKIHRDAQGADGPELDTGGAVAATRSGGRPLSEVDRAFFERRFDHDFGNVRVHTGVEAAAAADGVRARAYTVGEHIVMGAGQPGPGTTEGRRLLAHELTHVVQQGAASGPLQRKRDDKGSARRHDEQDGGRVDIGTTAPGTVQRDAWTPEQEASFQLWWKQIAKLEGTLADWKANPANKYDPGGETNFGITWATYQATHPNATKAQFAAMTVEEAMRIAKGLYRSYHADKIKDPGVASLIAESFWGAFSADALNNALQAVGLKRTATMGGGLNQETIDAINSTDPQKLIDAIVREREKYHGAVATNPHMTPFLHGWNTRWDARWVQAKIMTGHAVEAATWLNGKSKEEIQEKLGWMSQEDIAAIYQGAVGPGGVGPDSQLAKMTAHSFRVLKYKQAVAAGDWPAAAFYLNGFQRSDMMHFLRLLSPAQIAKLHAGALDPASGVGPDTDLAKSTASAAPPRGK